MACLPRHTVFERILTLNSSARKDTHHHEKMWDFHTCVNSARFFLSNRFLCLLLIQQSVFEAAQVSNRKLVPDQGKVFIKQFLQTRIRTKLSLSVLTFFNTHSPGNTVDNCKMFIHFNEGYLSKRILGKM